MSTIHFCNICACPSKETNVNFFLTCGHVLCKSCGKLEGSSVKCAVCGKMAGFRELNKLPENIRKTYFMKDLTEVFEESLKIVQFQQQQEQNTFENISKYRNRSKKIEKQLEKEIAEVRLKEAHLNKLKKHREQMQLKLAEIMKRENLKKSKPHSHQYRENYSNLSNIESASSISFAMTETTRPPLEDSNFRFTPSVNQNYFPSKSNTPSVNRTLTPMNQAKNIDHVKRFSQAHTSSTHSSTRSPFFA